MKHTENWIWLPVDKYKDDQTTIYSGFLSHEGVSYTVAEFFRDYRYEQSIVRAELRFSGDTEFQLFCNGRPIATGPAAVGGDFRANEKRRENFYSYEMTLEPNSNALSFFARVKLTPVRICEYSKGRGGFMLSAILTLADGSQELITTDESWSVRKNRAYSSPREYNGRLAADEYVSAQRVENIWHTETAPIPVRAERELAPENGRLTLAPGEEAKLTLDLGKIWGGFVHVVAKASGELSIKLSCHELEHSGGSGESVTVTHDTDYRGFFLHSAGYISAELKNNSDHAAEVRISFIATYYPIIEDVDTVTSDEQLNQVLQTCKHTLKICRQTHHLDSTSHCEPLACTGDYYIETLMTPFSFGDLRLSEFDLVRTAVMLEAEDGRMFHTTYSLIWVRMLYDVYMLTGNIATVERCLHALELLLRRFEGYVGENGLIETPPDYMFVDWIYIDGHSMHHPPKALGQSCLNMFYFGALDYAERLFMLCSRQEDAARCRERREALRGAINGLLFDPDKRMYFEGLNTPTDEKLLGQWMPKNTDKRYYMKHSNILAAYVGVCDDQLARELVGRIVRDEIPGDCQPYFLHYLLEAVSRLGLREYTLRLIERWKPEVLSCPRGLVEGFVKPEPGYSFDHSHAWGGTPLYSLPKALLGLRILAPGMSELELSPDLLGLSFARVELLTPHGKLSCQLEQGKAPIVSAPSGVRITLR